MSLCVTCRGRNFCGRKRCVVYERIKLLSDLKLNREFFGASPPSIFVGRFGYPNVSVGPLVAYSVDSQLSDSPNYWISKNLDISNILKYRTHLIGSVFKQNVKERGKLWQEVSEITLSTKPVDTEVKFKDVPKVRTIFDAYLAPLGLSGKVEKIKVVDNPKIPDIVYRIYEERIDTEKSIAILMKKFDIYYISRLLSAGILGIKKKMVPTRWSITAADSIASDIVLQEVKKFENIDDIMVYFNSYLDNRFAIILLPSKWSFELVEVYIPGCIWLNKNSTIHVVSDCERYMKRHGYAKNTGGAYYAARFSVAEHLLKIKRQATVIVLRVVGENYWAPLGVWVIRESVKKALSRKPYIAESLNDAINHACEMCNVRKEVWINSSKMLREVKEQTKLVEWFP